MAPACLSFVFILSGCSESHKGIFMHRVNTEMVSKDSIEINLAQMVNFKWKEVCFSCSQGMALTFLIEHQKK